MVHFVQKKQSPPGRTAAGFYEEARLENQINDSLAQSFTSFSLLRLGKSAVTRTCLANYRPHKSSITSCLRGEGNRVIPFPVCYRQRLHVASNPRRSVRISARSCISNRCADICLRLGQARSVCRALRVIPIRRQRNRRQDADNRHDDHEFDQRETLLYFFHDHPL